MDKDIKSDLVFFMKSESVLVFLLVGYLYYKITKI